MAGIWDDWAKHYAKMGNSPERICKDGVINPEKFKRANPKILFVLKDINNRGEGDRSHGVRDLPEWLKDGPRHQLWHTLARWAAGLLNDFPSYKTLDVVTVKESLERVAAINLKKACGKARVDPEIISAYTHQDRSLLIEQINSIKPDLIISCGVMQHLIWLLDLNVNPEDSKSDPVRDTMRKAWVVPFRHPTMASGEKIYNDLKRMVSRIKSKA